MFWVVELGIGSVLLTEVLVWCIMLPIVLRSLCKLVALGVKAWKEFLIVYFLLGIEVMAALIILVYILCQDFSRDSVVRVVSRTLCFSKLESTVLENSSHVSLVMAL